VRLDFEMQFIEMLKDFVSSWKKSRLFIDFFSKILSYVERNHRKFKEDETSHISKIGMDLLTEKFF